MKRLMVMFSLVFASSCAHSPVPIEIENATFDRDGQLNLASVVNFAIVNEAPPGESDPGIMGVSAYFFVDVNPSTPITVEEDMKEFLQSRLTISPEAEKSLFVTIRKAEAYWVLPGSRNNPFGIFAAGADVPFQLHLDVLFEVEVNGKVTASYTYDEIIEIKSSSTTGDRTIQSYKALIEEYRSRSYEEISAKFLKRYL